MGNCRLTGKIIQPVNNAVFRYGLNLLVLEGKLPDAVYSVNSYDDIV